MAGLLCSALLCCAVLCSGREEGGSQHRPADPESDITPLTSHKARCGAGVTDRSLAVERKKNN